MKKLLGTFLLTFLLSSSPAAQTQRGGGVRVLNERGEVESVKLYEGSYALVVGAVNYKYWPRLDGVREDVPAVRAVLERHGFKVDEVLDPTGDVLLSRINKFINDYGLYPDNRLLIYFSGHGYTEVSGDGRKFGYIVPVDAPKPEKDIIGFQQKSLTMDEIETFARRIRSKHALFVFDSCFSGTLVNKGGLHVPKVIDYYATRPVRQFITAGADNQEVPAESVFRQVFVRGLEGKADQNNDGYVTGTELATYLQEQVTYYRGEAQTPQYGKIRDPRLDTGDFIFILPDAPAPEPASTSASTSAPTPVAVVNPARARELAAQAMNSMLRGDFEEAIGLANESLSLDNLTALAYAVRGRSLQRQEDEKRDLRTGRAGLKDLETANQLEQSNGVFRAFLASAYRSAFMSEQAKSTAGEALKLLVSPASDVEFFAKGLATQLAPDYASGGPFLGGYSWAIGHYDSALKLNPRLVEAYVARGNAYANVIDPWGDKPSTDRELADLVKAIELNPRHVGARLRRAFIYLIKSQPALAITDYTKVIELRPRQAWAYDRRSVAYLFKGEYKQALADCTEAIRLEPNSPMLYRVRGSYYQQAGKDTKARADWAKAEELEKRGFKN